MKKNLKQSGTALTSNDDLIQSFLAIQPEYKNSLFHNDLIPMFLIDRKYRAKLPKTNPSIIEQTFNSELDALTISYTAATKKEKNNDDEHRYMPSTNERLVLKLLLHMATLKKADLSLASNNQVQVRFRREDLFRYATEMNRSRPRDAISHSLFVLSNAILTVKSTKTNPLNNEKTTYQVTGTYLQNYRSISSDNPRLDGLIETTFHPLISNDILQGNYREIENQYAFLSKSIISELYETTCAMLRHRFLHADAKDPSKTKYKFSAKELFFISGYHLFSKNSVRAKLKELSDLLVHHMVIYDDSAFTRTRVNDDSGEFLDYTCEIETSAEWGQSQRRANNIYRLKNDQITAAIQIDKT